MSTMIFPGMDPYLEHPQLWPDVHSRFIVYLAEHLQPLLAGRYVASVEQRVYVEGPDRDIRPDVHLKEERPGAYPTWFPAASQASSSASQPVLIEAEDLEISESYVAILDLESDGRVVTVIELLSPSNKLPGPGRDSYRHKQSEVCRSDAHLVEIDLLRAGIHTVAAPARKIAAHRHDYLASINRANSRRVFELYFIQLRDRLPTVHIPLIKGDPDVALDLQAVMTRTYESGSYRRRARYDEPCIPPLSPEDQQWAEQQIAAAT